MSRKIEKPPTDVHRGLSTKVYPKLIKNSNNPRSIYLKEIRCLSSKLIIIS